MNVLKSGMIHVGAMNCTTIRKTVAATQHHSQAHGPAQAKKKRMPVISVPPRNDRRREPLEEIGDEGRGCGAVEPEAGLQHEGAVESKWETEHRGCQTEGAHEEQSRGDRAVACGAHQPVDPLEAPLLPDSQHEREVDGAADQTEACRGLRVGLAARVGVAVVHTLKLPGRLGLMPAD